MKEVADGQDLIPIQSWRYLLNLHENLPARPGLFLLGWFKLYVCNGAVMIGSFEQAVFGVLHQNVTPRLPSLHWQWRYLLRYFLHKT